MPTMTDTHLRPADEREPEEALPAPLAGVRATVDGPRPVAHVETRSPVASCGRAIDTAASLGVAAGTAVRQEVPA
jgi:hypothetical protein